MEGNIKALEKARAARSERKIESVSKALNSMLSAGTRITISSVSRTAGVSRSYLYTGQPRVMVEAAKSQQQSAPTARTPSKWSISKSDFDLVAQQNRALRLEIRRLKQTLSQKVAKELDTRGVSELNDVLSALKEENSELSTELKSAKDKIARYSRLNDEMEEQLHASRVLLQRMIRESNEGQ